MIHLIIKITTKFIGKKEIGEIMKISTKGRYALRMLTDLAEHQGEGYIALKDIAKRQNISKKYLEQIVILLHGSDLLKASRGPNGGYQLAKAPKDCTVADILRQTAGSLAPIACLEAEPFGCERAEECLTLPVWKGLYKQITDYLEGITIQDILDHASQNAPLNFVI
jgi:Rrf2 family protein